MQNKESIIQIMTEDIIHKKTTLCFFTNPMRDSAVNGLKTALDKALSLGYNCCIDDETAEKRSGEFKGIPSVKTEVPDYIIAFGGDGTILHAADLASDLGAPILGVNLGRIGFLSEIMPDGFTDALKRLDDMNYSLDSRMQLSCSIDGDVEHECLNDALLYKRSFSGIVDISMEIDGISAGSVLCDGLIISTSTGATGYSISAGGPLIAPGLDAMIITPICPHTLYVRPIIAPENSRLRFSMNSEGYISLDGIYSSEIKTDDTITIKRSKRRVAFVRFGRQNLYSLVREKLT